MTSVGEVEIGVPRTRESGSPVDVLGRYKRRVSDVDAMITEAYVQGSSTRDVSRLTETLMGRKVSRSTVSRVTRSLEERMDALAREPISQEVPYLFLDATYVDARWARSVENVSALVAYGVGLDGHRHLLAVTIGSEESDESWGDLISKLLDRGLSGVKLVVSDDHRGIAKAVRRLLPEAKQQRCTVHLIRNVLAKTPHRLRGRIVRTLTAISGPRGACVPRKRIRRRDAVLLVSKESLDPDPLDQRSRAPPPRDQTEDQGRWRVPGSTERAPADHRRHPRDHCGLERPSLPRHGGIQSPSGEGGHRGGLIGLASPEPTSFSLNQPPLT